MIFALYQGRSLISGVIRRFTRSRYSHVAIQFADGAVFEAVARGVVRAESLAENHPAGTVVDLFAFVTPPALEHEQRARELCEELVGRDYDFASIVLGFPLRVAGDQNPRGEFCSELALKAAAQAGRPLQNMMPWRATPDHVAISLALRWKETIKL
jgi:hypothetical protein